MDDELDVNQLALAVIGHLAFKAGGELVVNIQELITTPFEGNDSVIFKEDGDVLRITVQMEPNVGAS